jgi:hypothetical protein
MDSNCSRSAFELQLAVAPRAEEGPKPEVVANGLGLGLGLGLGDLRL